MNKDFWQHLKLMLVFGLAILSLQTPAVAQQSIQAFQWKKRIIILHGEEGSSEVRKQMHAFKNLNEEILNRNVVLIALNSSMRMGFDSKERYYNEEEYGDILQKRDIPKKGFGILLIGLDGGTKYRSSSFVEPQSLFDLIDRMPMRQAEMRRKGN